MGVGFTTRLRNKIWTQLWRRQVNSSSWEDTMIQAMERHACTNMYTGILIGGDQYSGWPLTALAQAVMRNYSSVQQAEIVAAFQNKWALLGQPLTVTLVGGSGGGGGYSGGGYSGGGGGYSGGSGVVTIASTLRPAPEACYNLEEMLCMRMRWPTPIHGKGWHLGFVHVAPYNIGDKVFVWVVTKDAQSVVLEDEAPMYPSDALITKLNMLKQE